MGTYTSLILWDDLQYQFLFVNVFYPKLIILILMHITYDAVHIACSTVDMSYTTVYIYIGYSIVNIAYGNVHIVYSTIHVYSIMM